MLTMDHPVFYTKSATVKVSRCSCKNIKWYYLRPGQASLKSSDLPTPRLGVLVLILSTHIL